MNRRMFENVEGSSEKFWHIELDGNRHTVQFGRIGTQGQTKTKEFTNEEKAKQDFERLIAQKVKKGYQEISGEKANDTSKASEKKSTPKAKAKTKQKDVSTGDEVEKSKVNVRTEISRTLHLDDDDWMWATWRKREPRVRKKPTEFDLKACSAKMAAVKKEDYGWVWNWRFVDFPESMTPAEAHFWIVAMTKPRDARTGTPRQLGKELSAKGDEYHGKISLGWVRKRVEAAPGNFSNYSSTIPPDLVLPLTNIFSLRELFDFFTGEFAISNQARQYHTGVYDVLGLRSCFAEGLRRHVVAYLSEKEHEELKSRIRETLDPTKVTQQGDMPFEFYVAAFLGMYDEITPVVAGLSYQEHSRDPYSYSHWTRKYQWLVFGLDSAQSVEREMRRLKYYLWVPEAIRAWLACTELSALDYVRESIAVAPNRHLATPLLETFCRLVRAPEAAEPMLELMQSSKAPALARQWLEENVGNAIAGLIPTAVGRGKLADVAIQFLRSQKRRGYGKIIETCLKDVDQETAKKIHAEVLEFQEKVYNSFDAASTPKWLKSTCDRKKSKFPSFVNLTDLPPLVVGENRLNDEQVETALFALRASKFSEPSALITALRSNVDPTSRDAFAWHLFEHWLQEGAPSKERWAMGAVGFLGGDQSALKITPLIRAWPGESQHQRAVFGLECLRAIGTDTALMQLNGIAQKVKFQGIKKKAREAMEAIAKDKGMTREELEDRVVPDLGLDERGSREFDFGPRKFRFALAADMKPAVRDEDGKIRKDLPKPGANDDTEKAEAAVAEWKLLKKQLREAIKIQTPRLEQSMVTGRRWSVEEFESLLVRHPLMTNLVRTILWGGYDKKGDLKMTFRVTDEQDYADVDDGPCKLDGVAGIGIVHPLRLTDELAGRWGEVFSDYEIAAPFPQIGRATYALEKGEQKEKVIKRFGSVKIPALSLVGTLDRLGWQRGTPLDAGVFHEHSKTFYSANVTAIVEYEDGVPIGYMEGWDDQRITGCFFLEGQSGSGWDYPDHQKGIQLGQVDDIVISEVLSDLHVLASKGT